MTCLQICRELLSLPTFLRVHSNSKEVSHLSWQNTYPNPKTTCHIKVKFFLWTKLLENLLLAKYLISVAAPLNLIEDQPDIDEIYLYAKDLYECKYQYLINIREKVGFKRFNDTRAFVECSNDMCNVYRNINYYNPDKENKILTVFDDMTADMIQNKKLNSIVTELFIWGRKLNISLVFITELYFKVPKDFRLNATHFFITKILSKRLLNKLR